MLDLESCPAGRLIARGPNHIYLRPAPALAPYIAHYTVSHPSVGSRIAATGEMLTLMPDLGGCFVYGRSVGESALFWGAYTSTVQVSMDFEDSPTRFFVEFLPGGASRLMGLTMKEFANASVPAVLAHQEIHKRIEEAVENAVDIGVLIGFVDSLFLGLLQNAKGHDSAAPLMPLLAQTTGTRPVRELAEKTGYSERQLQRIFAQSVGVGVKTATRIVRLNRMLQFLQPGVSLTWLAQQAGYYDQAHLDHDFKAICGVSPSEYLRAVSGFYKEDYKF